MGAMPRPRRALAACLLAALASAAAGARLNYFIQAEEQRWSVNPLGRNNCTGAPFDETNGALWVTDGLGPVATKARFVAYTDESFTTPVPRPPEEAHLGLLGPPLRAAAGDELVVVFRNGLTFPANIEPTGLRPPAGGAQAEFAPAAQPGATVTYTWAVPEEASPDVASGEPSVKLWLYRSTVEFTGHADAGLTGPLLVHAGGAGSPPPAGRDVVTVLQVVNENSSPYYAANLASAGGSAQAVGFDADDELEESLLKHTINGRSFCSLEGLDFALGETVRWHAAAVGNEVDLHTLHWHAATFLRRGRRGDVVQLVPGAVESLEVEMDNPGTWLLHCHVNDHLRAGMTALYHVGGGPPPPGGGAGPAGAQPAPGPKAPPRAEPEPGGVVRRYFIAVEAGAWDYCPLGLDACTGEPFSEEQRVFTEATAVTVGSKYLKARYVQYSDESFTARVERPAGDAYLGLVGPILTAEVGDVLEVVLLNRLRAAPVTLHPHGVLYSKAGEGAPYNDGTSGGDKADDGVPAGGRHTYVWRVPERAGPGPSDASTILWLYHSHADEVADTYAGLFGGIVVGRRGALGPGRSLPAVGVDREAFMFFSVMNERESLGWPQNLASLAKPRAAAEADGEPDLMHSVNGYSYCGAPSPLAVKVGEAVRLHVMALGTEVDMHTPAATFGALRLGTGADATPQPALGVLPGAMFSADLVVTGSPGPRLLSCRVADHITAGMIAKVVVAPGDAAPAPAAAAATRSYFIQASVQDWDYAPLGGDACSGEVQPWAQEQEVFVVNGTGRIGSAYKKALYRQFTDASFTVEVPQPPERGFLGPLLAANAGDALEVVFRNSLPFAANIAFDGGLSSLSDGAAEAASPAVPVEPGQERAYKFAVPAELAPPADAPISTAAFGYGSSVDPVGHAAAGLLGLLLVGRAGTFGAPGAADAALPAGVDAVLPVAMGISNENASPLLGASAKAAGVDLAAVDLEEEEFVESNLMHGLSGRVFCNLQELTLRPGAVLRVAVLGFGSEADLHSLAFSGQVAGTASDGGAHAASGVMPAVARVVDVEVADAPGRWPVFCEVHDHRDAGMETALRVSDDANVAGAVGATSGAGGAARGLAAAAAAFLAAALA